MEEEARFYTTSSYFTTTDLHSRSATQTPKFDFTLTPSEEASTPISLLRCHHPHQTCMAIKRSFEVSWNSTPGTVRNEYLALDELEEGKEGWLLLAEDAAFLESNRDLPITILALLIPGNDKVRWSYHLLSITPLLRELDEKKLCSLHSHWPPGTPNHARFRTYIREAFVAATTIPHAPDYLNALQITDCCPHIIDPENALRRLEANEILYFAHKNPETAGMDLQDDRYLMCVEPAEREVANLAGLKCAEYLFVKRNFFRVFFERIYRSGKMVGMGREGKGALKGRDGGEGVLDEELGKEEEGEEALPTRSGRVRRAPSLPKGGRGRRQQQQQQQQHAAAPPPTAAVRAAEPYLTTRSGLQIYNPATTPVPTGSNSNKTGAGTAQPRRRASNRGDRADTPVAPPTGSGSGRHSAVWLAASGTVHTRVRTDTAHAHWLEREYGMRGQRAKLMVAAWRELGFLDERRYLEWVRRGGIGFCEEGEE